MTTRRLTNTQINWLIDLAKNKNPWDRIHGMSAHGGATCTAFSLRRRGFTDRENKITEAGHEAVAKYLPLRKPQ